MASDSRASEGWGDRQLSTLSISKKINPLEFSSPTQLVTFVVGKGKEKGIFVVQKEHACKYSPVLDNAFNREFQEGRTQKYEMEDTNPDTFRLFVQWLYSQKLAHIHYEEHLKLEINEGHCIKCLKATNEVMTLLQLVGRTCIGPFEGHVNYIYRNTGENSMLRRFVVNLIAWAAPSSDYLQYPHLYPHDFLLDLVTVFSAAVPPKTAANKRNRLVGTDFYVEERPE